MTFRNASRRTESLSATAQELGGAAEQTDRVRAGGVRTAGGEAVLLAVVADSEGSPAAGQAAARVVAQVFQAVEQSRTSELSQALRRGLEIAHQSLLNRSEGSSGPSRVAATAIAISKNRAYTAHIGSGVAIRVSKGRASRLTQQSDGRLGAEDDPGILSGPRDGFSLDRGDRVVLASDGIFRTNPASRQPFVLPAEIAQHTSELSPLEAARHLVSLALGRDVDDCVSVAVLGIPGASRSGRRSALRTLLAAGMILLVLGIAAVAWVARSRPAAANDYGFAVLVVGGVQAELADGTVQSVVNLGTIPAGSFVTALTEARLSLQSTFEAGSDLGEGTLYLGQDAQLELALLDPRSAAGESNSINGAGPTELRLQQGKLLVLRASGTREYLVHAQAVLVSLTGAGRGAMGVEAGGGQILMACLIGACRMTVGEGQDQLIQAGESLAAVEGTVQEPTLIPPAARAIWNELCASCLTGR
ncbi:MAG TPA: SpoIIE family protein phosphatase [Anaerolineales bacterium]